MSIDFFVPIKILLYVWVVASFPGAGGTLTGALIKGIKRWGQCYFHCRHTRRRKSGLTFNKNLVRQ